LVAWMDRKPVHVLTTHHDTSSVGTCKRRSAGGIIDVQRPEAVGRSNDYMDGVDIADQRRLHVETRIHGLHRWWIRLFFYGFDVALSNAFILYKESLPQAHRDRRMTMHQYRLALCEVWLRDSPSTSPSVDMNRSSSSPPPQHVLVRSAAFQMRCAVCARWCKSRESHSMGGKLQRPHYTTTMCSACNVPVCPPWSKRPCFAMLHENARVRELYLADAVKRRAHVNRKASTS
jgi:Transposase IS4